jgi:flagellar biosynthesis protein
MADPDPEQIACALRYDPEQENAPRLLAKGRGHIAERILQIAKEEDIPIVRDASLADTLFQMELDTQIPEEMFDAVSEVLKWVELLVRAQGEVPPWRKPRPEPAPG